jgi:3-oxoacyl-[acyl-carrier protein] reductase
VIGVNLTGATLMVREVAAKMVETGQKPGVDRQHVVDRPPRKPRPVQLRAAKAALAANTVTWSLEFAASASASAPSRPAWSRPR